MLRQRFGTVLAAALVMAAVPFTARPAPGQGVGGYYYESYRYGFNPGFYARRYTALPLGLPGKMAPAPGPYVNYVPAGRPRAAPRPSPVEVGILLGAKTSGPARRTARIELQVPEGAQVWFDGEKTTQTGTLRRFTSPPLAPGRGYAYQVRVVWKDGGREATETRALSVRAGDQVRTSFPARSAELPTGTAMPQ